MSSVLINVFVLKGQAEPWGERKKNQLVLGIYGVSWAEIVSSILKYTTLFGSEFKLLLD